MESNFYYGETYLSSSMALAIADGKVVGKLSATTLAKVAQSASYVADIVKEGRTVYGINTGFGPLCTSQINAADTKKLQENILKSHAVGVGEPISSRLAKLMLILKVQALAQGFSGIQVETLERIIWHIQEDIIPVVPKQGSVGASGDLAPLSHLFLPLIGLGKVVVDGQLFKTAEILATKNKEPLELGAKEGLALINGTQFMAAHAVLAVDRMHNVLMNADLIATLMLEGLNGSIKPFFKELHDLRPHKGNVFVASTIFNLLQHSEMVHAHQNCSRVQDPYSLRCIPQVHGASRNTWLHFKEIIETEINSVTDNPLIINKELTISGGSFHGQPIALPLDYATLAVSEIGNIADRRVYLSLEGDTPGVPKLLMEATGLNSGFMILQYTTAALASENKGLCFPASADSIPTSLGQEDHVSMGSIAGRKLLQVMANVEQIQSIELLCAAQALDFHRPKRSTPIVEALHACVRQQIPFLEADEVFDEWMQKSLHLVQSGKLIQLAREIAEKENIPYLGTGKENFDVF